HRNLGEDFLDHGGGSGGFRLLGESTRPVYVEDLPTSGALKGVLIVPLRLRTGDDASCLNLYKPRQPRLLGVPKSLIQRGGFNFAATEAHGAAQKSNPWLLLDHGPEDGAIPAFADANTAHWILKVKLGGIVEVADAAGVMVKLRLVGLLHESIFQSELL